MLLNGWEKFRSMSLKQVHWLICDVNLARDDTLGS